MTARAIWTKILPLVAVCLTLAACASAGTGKYAGRYITGVDGKGNAVWQEKGKPPVAASGPSVCLVSEYCGDLPSEQRD